MNQPLIDGCLTNTTEVDHPPILLRSLLRAVLVTQSRVSSCGFFNCVLWRYPKTHQYTMAYSHKPNQISLCWCLPADPHHPPMISLSPPGRMHQRSRRLDIEMADLHEISTLGYGTFGIVGALVLMSRRQGFPGSFLLVGWRLKGARSGSEGWQLI